MDITPIKGMPDFYPENQEIIEYLQNKWMSIGSKYGYQKFDGPVLEPIELYLEKTSEEIVNEQTFIVIDKKGNRFVLRPELTPTLARMIVKKEFELSVPIRWQSFGRFFRYEKPQKGRNRSFYQWNIDLIGEDNIFADIEILEIAANCLKSVGLVPEQVKIRFSNRLMIQDCLKKTFMLDDSVINSILRIIDKLDKKPIEGTVKSLKDLSLREDQVSFVIDFFTTDTIPIQDPWLDKITDYLKKMGIADYFVFDRKIIRGFDYYTGLVFEAWPASNLKRAVFGGGRYDNLTKTVGGKRELPGVGFAVGDAAMLEVLKEFCLLPEIKKSKVLFIPLTEDAFIESKKYIAALHKRNVIAQIHNKIESRLKNTLKYAAKEKFNFVVIIGTDELSKNVVNVKNLYTYEEQEINNNDLTDYLLSEMKEQISS